MPPAVVPHGKDPGAAHAHVPPSARGRRTRPPGHGPRSRPGVADWTARASLLRRGSLIASAITLMCLLPSSAAATAMPSATTAASGHAEALEWQPCATAAKDWPLQGDTRTECAELSVPLDYAKPESRTITIAVSRIRATGSGAKGAPLFFGAGGPGTSNLAAPASLLSSGLTVLGSDHDIVSMDSRGSGYSDKITCRENPGPELPTTATEEERDKAAFGLEAELNKRCTALDPEFVRQLTPANVARDIDTLRTALGASKIDFYGVSFDTATGLAYRSLFDNRVERMWLDSVMPPVFDHSTMDGDIEAVSQRTFDGFARWLARHDAEYHLGTDTPVVKARLIGLRDELDRHPRIVGDAWMDGQWVASLLGSDPVSWALSANDLVVALDGGTPDPASVDAAPHRRTFGLSDPRGGLNAIQYNAMLCNTDSSSTSFTEMWAAMQERRAADPAVGGTYFSPWCADWPLHAPATPVKRGSSPLQLSGHKGEGVTPYKWAVQTSERTGGAMLTVLDSVHGSLKSLPCASKAVDFFRGGKPSDGTCPGVQ